jgi:hypothetical protein
MKKSIKIALGVDLLLLVAFVGGSMLIDTSLWLLGLIIWLFLSAGSVAVITAGLFETKEDK